MQPSRRDQSSQRRTSFLLIAIILGAALLRLVAIGRDSLWLDEAISYLTAELSPLQIVNNTIKDPHPPLYYLLLHYWIRLVSSTLDASVRFFGVMWDLLLIPVVYLLGRRLFRQTQFAILPALFVAIAPFHVNYSHELRMYTMLMFLTSLTALLYLMARQRQKWQWWLLFALAALLSIYTHLFAFFVLMALGIHALNKRHDRQALQRTILVGLVLFILFLPWIAILANESQYDLGSLRPLAGTREGESTLGKLIATFTFLLFGQSTATWYYAVALFLIVAVVAILFLELRNIRRNRGFDEIGLPLLLIGCIISMPLSVYAVRPFFLPERTMAAASPFLLILLAWFMGQKRSLLPYLTGAVVLVMFAGTLLYLQSEARKPPYREAIRFVETQRLPQDAVLHSSDGSYLPALRYVDFPQHGLLAGDPDFRKPREVYEAYGGEIWARTDVEEKGDRLWLIVAREHSIPWQEEQLDYFSNRYVELESHLFGGIEVKLYQLTPSSIGNRE